MRITKPNSLISWILLVYFALFIVPPVSTFASSPRNLPAVAPEAQPECSLLPERPRAPLLFFDIILWEQLKKTKNSEEFLAVSPDDFDLGAGTQACEVELPVQLASDLPASADFTEPVLLTHQSRSSYIRFSRSGISPPAFYF